VEIWTIAAGNRLPGQLLSDYAMLLHGMWQLGDDVPAKRAAEDAACCQVLGAVYRRYNMPDSIYRVVPGTNQPVVDVPEALYANPEPVESYLIGQVADWIRKNLPEDAELVAPLSIGSHRDHVIVRRAADQLGFPVWHYVDYPYMVQGEYRLEEWVPQNVEKFEVTITPAGLKAWQDGFAKQHSQIVLFWKDEEEMRKAIEAYFNKGWGFTIWKF